MNQLETVPPDKPQQKRILSFDILRGFSIILMLIAHVGTYWLKSESQWLVALYFLVVDVEGTNGFTFTAGLGYGYAWAYDRDHSHSYKEINQRIARRTGLLLIFSLGYNLFAISARGQALWFEYFWYWGILQCICICRLCGMLFMRIGKKMRLVVALVIIVCTVGIVEWLLPDPTSHPLKAVIFYLFFNPMYANGLLFYLPFFLGGTIVGEWCYQLPKVALPGRVKLKGHIHHLWKEIPITYLWISVGIIAFVGGILIGWEGVNWDYGWNLLAKINTHPQIDWITLPLFLVANSYAWVLYSLGFEILVAMGLILVIDYYQIGRKYYLTTNFGKYSLTVYFGHYTFLFWPFLRTQFDHRTIWLPLCGFLLLWTGILYLIEYKTRGQGSIEYLLKQIEGIKPKINKIKN